MCTVIITFSIKSSLAISDGCVIITVSVNSSKDSEIKALGICISGLNAKPCAVEPPACRHSYEQAKRSVGYNCLDERCFRNVLTEKISPLSIAISNKLASGKVQHTRSGLISENELQDPTQNT